MQLGCANVWVFSEWTESRTKEQTMQYRIEVHSLGYEDTFKIVDAPSLRVANQERSKAIVEWADHNALDFDGVWDLPFTRTIKVSNKSVECPRCGEGDPCACESSAQGKVW